MTALWGDIQNEVKRQMALVGARVIPAGAASAGKIKLRIDPTVATDADELYAVVLPFVPAAGSDAVVLKVGGKNVVLGSLGNAAGPRIYSGSGSPEGVVTAAVGSLYLRSNGSAGTILYEKATGTGNTGWVANSATAPTADVTLQTYFGSFTDQFPTTTTTTDTGGTFYVGGSGSFTLPTGTWDVWMSGGQRLAHSADGQTECRLDIDGDNGTLIQGACSSVVSLFQCEHAIAGASGSTSWQFEARPDIAGTLTFGDSTVEIKAKRTV